MNYKVENVGPSGVVKVGLLQRNEPVAVPLPAAALPRTTLGKLYWHEAV